MAQRPSGPNFLETQLTELPRPVSRGQR